MAQAMLRHESASAGVTETSSVNHPPCSDPQASPTSLPGLGEKRIYQLTNARVPVQMLEDVRDEQSDLVRRLATQTLSISVHRLYTEHLTRINEWIAHVKSNDLIDK